MELLPCPFCGNKEPKIVREMEISGGQGYIARCGNRSWCGARQHVLGTEYAAASAWNRRKI